MDQTRVRELLALLPPGAAYPAIPRRSHFQPRPSASERFALALHDPAFGWNFVEAHLKQRRWLPDTVHEWALLQCFLARRLDVPEPLIVEVESFRTDARRHDRNLLEALLLAKSVTLGDIADHLHISKEVVEAYETIFWNVRDRLDERGYINALLYPDGVQAAARDARPDAVGDRLRLLRAGVQNDVGEVLALAGYKLASNPGALTEDNGEVERRMQQDAQRRIRAGCRMEDPVVKIVYAAAARRKEIALTEDELALHKINAVSPALDEIRKHNGLKGLPPPDYRELIAGARAKAAPVIRDLLRNGGGSAN